MGVRGERLQKVTESQKSVAGNFFSWAPTSTNLDVPHLYNGYVGCGPGVRIHVSPLEKVDLNSY
jgi:hypothetical protein